MPFVLRNSTIEEQRGVIRFLTAEGVRPSEIHRRMLVVYGTDCVSYKSVNKWSARFREGRECLTDDPRPGQANAVITAELIGRVNELIKSDRLVTMRMLAGMVGASVGTVSTILHDSLGYRKVCAEWVPNKSSEVSEPQKTSESSDTPPKRGRASSKGPPPKRALKKKNEPTPKESTTAVGDMKRGRKPKAAKPASEVEEAEDEATKRASGTEEVGHDTAKPSTSETDKLEDEAAEKDEE